MGSVNITEKVTKRIEISELEKMALQQFLSKYKNGLVATGVTATFVPIMYSFNKKALFTSQVVNIGVQLGAQAYVAGIAGPSMFSNLDKDTFAKVQAVLFPRYILATSATSLLALLGYMKQNPTATLLCPAHTGFFLTVSLATNLLNLWVFFPWTHEVLVTYMDAEKSGADEQVVKKARMNFGIVHGIANLINYGTMMANLVFLYKLTTAHMA